MPRSTKAAKATKAALYARCSTNEQSVDPQLYQLRRFAKARDLEIVSEYTDAGVSGTRASRPGLNALLADAKRGRFKVVVVVRLDRLGRSLHHLLEVLGELEAIGVDLVSYDDSIDTRTPAGRLFMQIRGAFAEYERELIVERTKAGMDAARRKGKRIGRPPVTDRKKRERIRRLRKSGRTVRAIAELVGVSTATTERVLARA